MTVFFGCRLAVMSIVFRRRLPPKAFLEDMKTKQLGWAYLCRATLQEKVDGLAGRTKEFKAFDSFIGRRGHKPFKNEASCLEFLIAELSAFQSKKALLYALPAECAGALYNMCETCGRHLVLKRLAHALEAALQERLAGGLSQLSFDVLKGDLEMWNHPGTSKFKTSNSAFAAWRSTVRAASFLVKEHIRFERERPVGAGASVSSLAGISGRHWQRPLQFCALGHAMFNMWLQSPLELIPCLVSGYIKLRAGGFAASPSR